MKAIITFLCPNTLDEKIVDVKDGLHVVLYEEQETKTGKTIVIKQDAGTWFYQQEQGWHSIPSSSRISLQEGYTLSISIVKDQLVFSPYFYKQERLLVGRSSQCDLSFQHMDVSRFHLCITKQDQGWVIEDCKSKHGVYVNKKRIQEVYLQLGDEVYFSGITFYFLDFCLWFRNVPISNEQSIKIPCCDELPFDIQNLQLPSFSPSNIPCHPPTVDYHQSSSVMVQLLPTLISGMASLMMACSMMVAFHKQGDALQNLPSILMIASILLCSCLLPMLLFYLQKRRETKRLMAEEASYETYINQRSKLMVQQVEAYQSYLSNLVKLWLPKKTEVVKLWFLHQNDSLWFTFTIGTKDILYPIHIEQTVQDEHPVQTKSYKLYVSLMKQCTASIHDYVFFDFKQYTSIGVTGTYANSVAFSILWQLCKNQSEDEWSLIVILPESLTRAYHLRFLPHVWVSNHQRTLYQSIHSMDLTQCIEESKKQKKDVFLFTTESVPHRIAKEVYWLQVAKDEKELSKQHSLVLDCQKENFIHVKEYQYEYELKYQGYCTPFLKQAFHQLETYMTTHESSFPFRFLDLYRVSNVNDLDILERWKKNHGCSLSVPVGMDEHRACIYFDAHASKHGPHGLLAGMTGSGKSEWMMSYILALCVEFSCEDVSFVIVDYKGGMMGNGLALLPHISSVITNLEKTRIQRFLDALDEEISDRQKTFEEAKLRMQTSFCDIDQYQQWFHAGYLDKPISHLFVMVDEFAEMKLESPDALAYIQKIARIGRSLGIHILLATQKPYGIVDDQVWSNCSAHICLKVQQRNDSMDVLKKEDAWYLRQPGEFYLQVGHDEYYVKGKSCYTQAYYENTAIYQAKEEPYMQVYDSQGKVIHTWQMEKKEGFMTQFEAVVKEINRIQEQGCYKRPFFLQPDLHYACISTLYSDSHICMGMFEDSKTRKQNSFTISLHQPLRWLMAGCHLDELEMSATMFLLECQRLYSIDQCVVWIFDDQTALHQMEQLSIVSGCFTWNQQDFIDAFMEQFASIQKDCECIKVIVVVNPNGWNIHQPKLMKLLMDWMKEEQPMVHFLFISTHLQTLPFSFFSLFHEFSFFYMADKQEYATYVPSFTVYPHFQFGNGVFMDEQHQVELQILPYDENCKQKLLHKGRKKNTLYQLRVFPKHITKKFDQKGLYVGISYQTKEDVFIPLKKERPLLILQAHQLSQGYVKYIQEWCMNFDQQHTWQLILHELSPSIQPSIFCLTIEELYTYQLEPWFSSWFSSVSILWLGEGMEQMQVFPYWKITSDLQMKEIDAYYQDALVQVKIRRMEEDECG